MLSTDDLLRLALEVHVDPRTVRRYVDGETVLPVTANAINLAATKLRIKLPVANK